MLLSLELENVFSIKKIKLDFVKARYTYKQDMIYNDLAINPLAIYGFNGSGKSSLFKAMAFLSSFWQKGPNMELEHNYLLEQQLLKEKNSEPYLLSKFSLKFKLENNIYLYNLVICDKEVAKEELIENEFKLFERIGNKYLLSIYNNSYNETKLKDKSLFLELNDFNLVYDYLKDINVVLDDRISSQTNVLKNKNIYDLFYKYQKEINDLLSDIPGSNNFSITKENFNYQLIYNNNYLTIDKMSKGLFNINMLFSLILASPRGSLLFVDDLDSNLHPFVLNKILTLIKEKDIQLIFSSHNTHLMQYLRPDQIYLVGFNGVYSSYKRLSEMKDSIREINNIEKMYLAYAFKA